MRVEIPVVATDAANAVVAGASIDIIDRETGLPPTVFQGETGGATRSLPLTTGPNGRAPRSYVDRGAYTITITAPAIGTDTIDWDATPGRDKAIDGAWLADAAADSRVITGVAVGDLAADVLARIAPFAADTVRSTDSVAMTSASSFTDVPGASVVLEPAVPSLVLVTAAFEFDMSVPNNTSSADMKGLLDVDGTLQDDVARATLAPSASTHLAVTAAQTWVVALTAAAHTLKLRTVGPIFGTATCAVSGSFTYLMLPA